MTNQKLSELLKKSLLIKMTAREKRDQSISFILGNGAVEGPPLHRGTVSMAVAPSSTMQRPHAGSMVVPEAPAVPFDVNGIVRQFELVQSLIVRNLDDGSVSITPELILKLHNEAGDGSHPAFGSYRQVDVKIGGSQHLPPDPSAIPRAIEEMCASIMERWDMDDAVALSSFALWKLLWIHPFVDGNGRTARALCYLIIGLKVKTLLPGTPTLPEQLSERREQYYDALYAADLAFAEVGQVNLNPLINLINELLVRQLRSSPALSTRDEKQVSEIVLRRIGQLEPRIRKALFGSESVTHRAWAISEYLIFQIGSHEALESTETQFEAISDPFPKLLAAPGERAVLSLLANQRGAIIRPRTFELNEGAALWLEPNAAVVVEQPHLVYQENSGRNVSWKLDGVLYILRQGDEVSDLWLLDILEILISRHVEVAHST
jgi:fido (protein-threonine AMPylation protein)